MSGSPVEITPLMKMREALATVAPLIVLAYEAQREPLTVTDEDVRESVHATCTFQANPPSPMSRMRDALEAFIARKNAAKEFRWADDADGSGPINEAELAARIDAARTEFHARKNAVSVSSEQPDSAPMCKHAVNAELCGDCHDAKERSHPAPAPTPTPTCKWCGEPIYSYEQPQFSPNMLGATPYPNVPRHVWRHTKSHADKCYETPVATPVDEVK